MKGLKELIHDHSVDNLRIGKIISKDETAFVVRIGDTEVTCSYTGSAYVGQIVAMECPDGDLTKAYILSTAPIGIGEGETVAI
jgi:hypothetical protein